MPVAHPRIFVGRLLRRILLGLDPDPALIADIGEEPRHLVVVDEAVPRHREDAVEDRGEEALVLLARGLQYVPPQVLAVDVIDAAGVLLQRCGDVAAGEPGWAV